MIAFSMPRLWAIMRKEFVLMRRDPAIIVIMAIMPLILVCMAGFAVNTFPEHVPTVLVNYDNSHLTRDLVRRLEQTGYFSFIQSTFDPEEAHHSLRSHQALLVLTIPANFTKDFYRQKNPSVLVEDGGIDAYSTSRALMALSGVKHALLKDQALNASFNRLSHASFNVINHRLYDPELNSRIYVVPGMIGLVLMLTMLMITIIIAFRDIQNGTIEYLLTSPTRPMEILLGEILAYIIVGYVQLTFGLLLAHYVLHLPFVGHLGLLYLCVLPYIIAELSLGLTIATCCKTQFEAVQVINAFIALSILLSGFVFPIFGMPSWAQVMSLFLPLTYFFKLLNSIMLKGSELHELWHYLWPLMIYSVVMISIATLRFKRQLS